MARVFQTLETGLGGNNTSAANKDNVSRFYANLCGNSLGNCFFSNDEIILANVNPYRIITHHGSCNLYQMFKKYKALKKVDETMKELEKQIKKKEKKKCNNLRKERDVLILVLLVFNIIELIGAIIVKR